MNADPCGSFPFFHNPAVQKDTFAYETALALQGFSAIAGVDEAGRGPLAGPVIAACVILSEKSDYSLFRDSKVLTALRREKLFDVLQNSGSAIGIGIVSAREIERLNILQASLLAMKLAVCQCGDTGNNSVPDFLLVDGKFKVPLTTAQQPLVKGESKSASIAAASIIAKVVRDRKMAAAHQQYPQYNFIRNQGYPTKEHRQAIARFGPCPLHRRTFKGVREFVVPVEDQDQPRQGGLW